MCRFFLGGGGGGGGSGYMNFEYLFVLYFVVVLFNGWKNFFFKNEI